MTSTSFFIIKAISFIVFVYNLASSDWSNLSRVLLFIISFFVFLLVTNVYQRKVKIVTLGYLVYFFLAFSSKCRSICNYLQFSHTEFDTEVS